jgi:hypothetical protein
MGRKKIFLTDDEKRMAQNKWAMNYYFRNQEKIKQKNLIRYYERKIRKEK